MPICVGKNGSGPTVLLTGGIHGDEYEGQIAVSRLARELDPASVQGRVIMLPAVNLPAVMADTRLSTVDGRDMNRCLPGDPRGTFREMIWHFREGTVCPSADAYVVRQPPGHSGGTA